MNCIRVNTGTSYDVLIRHGILRDAGKEIMKVMPNARLAVVTDSNVSPLYLRRLLDSLEQADTITSRPLPWPQARTPNH